jgi:hypothetical protein
LQDCISQSSITSKAKPDMLGMMRSPLGAKHINHEANLYRVFKQLKEMQCNV